MRSDPPTLEASSNDGLGTSQPPGPGLPLQALSVKISIESSTKGIPFSARWQP